MQCVQTASAMALPISWVEAVPLVANSRAPTSSMRSPGKRVSGRGLHSPTVAQSGRDAVDGQVDPVHDALVRVAAAMPLQKLDLQVVQRIEVGETVADRAREQPVLLEQRAAAP